MPGLQVVPMCFLYWHSQATLPRIQTSHSSPASPLCGPHHIPLVHSLLCELGGWGLWAEVVHLVALELTDISGLANTQVVWNIEFEGILTTGL